MAGTGSPEGSVAHAAYGGGGRATRRFGLHNRRQVAGGAGKARSPDIPKLGISFSDVSRSLGPSPATFLKAGRASQASTRDRQQLSSGDQRLQRSLRVRQASSKEREARAYGGNGAPVVREEALSQMFDAARAAQRDGGKAQRRAGRRAQPSKASRQRVRGGGGGSFAHHLSGAEAPMPMAQMDKPDTPAARSRRSAGDPTGARGLLKAPQGASSAIRPRGGSRRKSAPAPRQREPELTSSLRRGNGGTPRSAGRAGRLRRGRSPSASQMITNFTTQRRSEEEVVDLVSDDDEVEDAAPAGGASPGFEEIPVLRCFGSASNGGAAVGRLKPLSAVSALSFNKGGAILVKLQGSSPVRLLPLTRISENTEGDAIFEDLTVRCPRAAWWLLLRANAAGCAGGDASVAHRRRPHHSHLPL